MSATVKLTGPERSGEVLPIVLWFAERLQQSDTKKKEKKKNMLDIDKEQTMTRT